MSSFKTVAHANDLEAFYDLWDQSNNVTLKLEALRWACAFDREDMIDCILDSKELNNTDVTVAFKEATRYKSLNAIGQLLRWCRWDNRFEQEHMGIPSSKYLNEIGHTALMSDWSAVFATHKERFKNLSSIDRSQLYLRGVREGAVGCLKVMDNGSAAMNWYESFRTAIGALQSSSVRYILEHRSPFDQKGQHQKAIESLANLVADPYLFSHPQALDCAMVLMEFVSPQEVRTAYPRFTQARLSQVLDQVTSMYQQQLLQKVVATVESKDAHSSKRKM